MNSAGSSASRERLNSPKPVVPDHTLFQPIGRGAYGEVWLGCNVMGTPRAVKVVWRKQFESRRPFEREFAGIQRYEPVSRSSGGLVHVLHVGKNEAEEYFYYVMELADDAESGPQPSIPLKSQPASPDSQNPAAEPPVSTSYQPRTLRSDLKRLGRLCTADCLRLAIDVASGLGQLHRLGLIHRDVKPGNIIYVNGRAKLADIGLVTTEGEGRTFVGTEGYVPPEGPGTPAGDLYALGIALYEASTGFSPERLPDVPPEWITSAEGDQALELHEIVLKACEGQRERRYSNADEMQADLALLQSGQSVRHMRALKRRYARLRTAGMAGATLLALALGTALLANYRARLESEARAHESFLRKEAQQAQARAESAELDARRQFQTALYEEARALVLTREVGHRTKALDAIRRAEGSTNAAELRKVAFAALGLPDLRLERELPLPAPLSMARISPTLQQLALDGGLGAITIRSIPDLSVVASIPPSPPTQTYEVLWSPDGRYIAAKRQYDGIGSRSRLEVWNTSRQGCVLRTGADIAYGSFAFHPRLPMLITGHTDGKVSSCELDGGGEQGDFNLPTSTLHSLSCSAQGDRLAASYLRGSNWVVAVHDAQNGALLGTTTVPEPVSSIVWHPQSEWVSFIGDDPSDWNRGVWLIAPQTGAITQLGTHKIKTSGVSFSPDGNYLASCGWERELICWDLRTQQRAFTCSDAGYSLVWGADGTHCAMIARRNTRLQLFTFEPPLCRQLIGNRGEHLRPGAFSPDGRWLALPDNQGLCVWDLGSKDRPIVLTEKPPSPPFFSADSSELFALDGKGGRAQLKRWHLASASKAGDTPHLEPLPASGQTRLNWAGLAGDVLALASEEGLRLAALTNSGWAEGQLIKSAAGTAAFSPEKQWLAVTYSYSPTVTVYHLPEVLQVARFQTSHFVGSVWFSPSGDELTVINRSGVERWDTATWQLKRREPGSPISEAYLIYSPDGRGVWRVTNFRDTAYCDRDTLDPILPLPANVVPLALSSDGRQLAVSVDDQQVQVWDLPELRKHFRDLGLDW